MQVDYNGDNCKVVNKAELVFPQACRSDCNETAIETCEDYLTCLGTKCKLANVDRRNLTICKCEVDLVVPRPMKKPVYMYYGLSNFYQNHRRYLNSWSTDQLRGDLNDLGDCSPITDEKPPNETTKQPFVPCGLIGNSYFNGKLYSTSDNCY